MADVILLRWINGGFLRPEDFKEVKKPLIWVLSDVWPFTGGCHYPANCDRFEREWKITTRSGSQSIAFEAANAPGGGASR